MAAFASSSATAFATPPSKVALDQQVADKLWNDFKKRVNWVSKMSPEEELKTRQIYFAVWQKAYERQQAERRTQAIIDAAQADRKKRQQKLAKLSGSPPAQVVPTVQRKISDFYDANGNVQVDAFADYLREQTPEQLRAIAANQSGRFQQIVEYDIAHPSKSGRLPKDTAKSLALLYAHSEDEFAADLADSKYAVSVDQVMQTVQRLQDKALPLNLSMYVSREELNALLDEFDAIDAQQSDQQERAIQRLAAIVQLNRNKEASQNDKQRQATQVAKNLLYNSLRGQINQAITDLGSLSSSKSPERRRQLTQLLALAGDSYEGWEAIPPEQRINEIAAAVQQTPLATELQLQGGFLSNLRNAAAGVGAATGNAVVTAAPAAIYLYEAITTGDTSRLSSALATYALMTSASVAMQWVSRYITTQPAATELIRKQLENPSGPQYYDSMSVALHQVGLERLSKLYSTAGDTLADLKGRIERGGTPASFAAGLVILSLSAAAGAQLHGAAAALVKSAGGYVAPLLDQAALDVFSRQFQHIAVGAASAPLDMVGLSAIKNTFFAWASPEFKARYVNGRIPSIACLLLYTAFGKNRLTEGLQWMRGFDPTLTRQDVEQIVERVETELNDKKNPVQFWIDESKLPSNMSPATLASTTTAATSQVPPMYAGLTTSTAANTSPVVDNVATAAVCKNINVPLSKAFQSVQAAELTTRALDRIEAQQGSSVTTEQAQSFASLVNLSPAECSAVGVAVDFARRLRSESGGGAATTTSWTSSIFSEQPVTTSAAAAASAQSQSQSQGQDLGEALDHGVLLPNFIPDFSWLRRWIHGAKCVVNLAHYVASSGRLSLLPADITGETGVPGYQCNFEDFADTAESVAQGQQVVRNREYYIDE
jgi:hypothetical protein